MFKDLIENIALLITLCWMHRMIMRYLDGHNKLSKICEGLLFGIVCIIGMKSPLVLIDGVIIDGRAALLSMASLFGGPLVGAIAGVMAGSYRFWLGGVGAIPGLLSILMPVLMGLAFRHMHHRGWIPFNVGSLLILGLMLEGSEILSLALLPAEYFSLFLKLALVPLMIVLIPATLLLGLMLKDDQQQKINREALRQSEAYLRAISEAVPDLSIVLDEEGRYLKINVPDNDLLFTGATELLGKRLQDVLPANQADIFMNFISRTLASESPQTIEYEIKSKKGLRNFEARARRLDTLIQGRRAVVLMARDITERVAYDQDRRIASIAFESQEGMIITDAQTRIIKVNRAFARITGYTEAEVIGQPTRMLDSSHEAPEFYQELWQTLIEDGFWQGEIANRRKSGEVFPEWLTISAVRDKQDRVINYVASFTDITERKSAEQKIQHLAFYDSLTNLPNRRLLRDRLQQAMALCDRNGIYGALIFLDLDDFKNVNDLCGHQVGDELLCHVAKRLTKTLREQDTVARLGGDEFVILLEGLQPDAEKASSQVEQIGIKLLEALRQPYLVDGWHFNNTTSLGVVMFNDAHHTVDELMQHADLSMYSSKASGKNALIFYDPKMQETVSLRLKLEEDIRRGLAAGEFVIYLQSQAGIHRQLEGAEALVRWHHPQRGLLGPDVFIEIAERSDLIELMDLATLRQGCELLACWADQPQSAVLNLAVNISSKLLYRDDFIALIKHLLDETHANPQLLKLEITESLLLTDKNKAVIRMQTLRELGIRFSIDDFGTGYSSMAYLQQLPLDQLKIDQSFVRDLPKNTSSLAIVRAILAMADSLGLEVIAEGVETQAQYDALCDSGCKHFQGYLFGKPVAVEAFKTATATY
ncbi:EAL domain-containing protein [Pseudomonas sp. NPDC096917]|uniref:EAL domain-containing protein n=1 Tax=Pseudomonas sp. NPDC096917 TaxID=3364483 RepID=UPI00383A941B